MATTQDLADAGFTSDEISAHTDKDLSGLGLDKSSIDQARQAGYSDDEINAYIKPRWTQAREAGYTDDDIRAHLGIEQPKPPPKIPDSFVHRLLISSRWDNVLAQGAAGAVQGFGDRPTEFYTGMNSLLQMGGIFPDPATGRAGAIRIANEALWRPVLSTIDVMARSAAAGYTGLQSVVRQFGVPEDVLAIPEAFAGAPGTFHVGVPPEVVTQISRIQRGEPFSRLEPSITGPQEVKIANGLPQAEDFQNAAEAIVGKGEDTAAVKGKLEAAWERAGVHPVEVARDASTDPVLSQDLVATNFPGARHYEPEGSAPKGEISPYEMNLEDDITGGAGGGKPPGGEPPPEEAPEPGSIDAAQKAILDKISVGDGEPGRPASLARLYTAAVDKFYPLKLAVNEATEGKGLPASQDPYALARLTAGAAGKAEHFLRFGQFDFNTYENNGPSLTAILKPVSKDMDGLRAYAASARAIELDGRGIKTPFDLDAARQVVAAGADKYAPIVQQLIGYQNGLTRYLKDSGVLSAKGYDAMLDANKAFVPFHRVIPGEGFGVGGRGLQASNPIKAIKGSGRDVIDPIESIIRNTYAYVQLAEKNAVGTKLVDMLKQADEGHVYTSDIEPAPLNADASIRAKAADTVEDVDGAKLPPKPQALLEAPIASGEAPETLPAIRRIDEPGKDALHSDVAEFMQGHGVTDVPDEFTAIVRTAGREAEGDEISIMRDGQRETYKVDPELARAFKGLDVESVNLIIRVLSIPAKLLRAGTVLLPEFITRHIFRDYLYASVTSEGIFTPADMAKGISGLVMKDAGYQQFLKSGGGNNSIVSLDRRYMQENLRKLTADTGLGTRALNVLAHPLDTIRAFTEVAENASHLGAFKKALGEQTGKEAIQQAGYVSRETAIDTARMGASPAMRAWNMLSAFANVTIQDTDRIVRAFKTNPVSTTLKVTGAVVLPSALLWWHNNDDTKDPTTGLSNLDRYKEVPQWEKDLFWLVMTRDHIFRIPKPFGMGVIFGSGTERLLDTYAAKNPGAFKDFGKSLMDTVVPGIIPTAAAPLIDQFANRSTFTGNPLVPDRLEKLLPEYQFNPYTTELAKTIGRVIGAFPGVKQASIDSGGIPLIGGTARALTSPALVENYIREWTGGLGTYVLHAADKGLRAAGVLPDPVMPASTLADIPFVKAFVVRYPASSAQSIQSFYDRYEQDKIVYNSIQAAAQDGNLEAMNREMAFSPRAMVQLDSIQQALSQHSMMIRMIYKNPDMSPSDKRQLIDTLYFRMIEVARAGNQALDVIDQPAK